MGIEQSRQQPEISKEAQAMLKDIFSKFDQDTVLDKKEARWLEKVSDKLKTDEAAIRYLNQVVATQEEKINLETSILGAKTGASRQNSKNILEKIMGQVTGYEKPKPTFVPEKNRNIEQLVTKFKGFEKIPASAFLKMNLENLRAIFLDKNGIIDFKGNGRARKYIGLGDLFPASQKYIKVNGKLGIRSFVGNHVGYVNQNGKYLAILGGEKIETDIDNKNQNNEMFKNVSQISEEEESVKKEERIKEISKEEKLWEKRTEEMNKTLQEHGIDPKSLENMDPGEKFQKVAKIYAKSVGEEFGIPPTVILAQSCLESGFGKHAIGNNLFGYKRGSWSGATQLRWTTEYFTPEQKQNWETKNPGLKINSEGRNKYKVQDHFRDYDNMYDSFRDYARLIRGNSDKNTPPTSRYKEAFKHTNDPKKFLTTVIEKGYATDPKYVNKATDVLQKQGINWNNQNLS